MECLTVRIEDLNRGHETRDNDQDVSRAQGHQQLVEHIGDHGLVEQGDDAEDVAKETQTNGDEGEVTCDHDLGGDQS